MKRRFRPQSWHAVIVLSLLAFIMLALHNRAVRAEVALASSPKAEGQEQFFIELAARPDAKEWFDSLSPAQRLTVSNNIGQYDAPELPKLITKLINTFDEKARFALAEALGAIAKTNPEAVAAEMGTGSSFSREATTRALLALGNKSVDIVAAQLSGPNRDPAAAYLAALGTPAESKLIDLLRSGDPATKVGASKALGLMRSTQAVPLLLDTYSRGDAELKDAALVALAGIGDPKTEGLLITVATTGSDKNLRAQAATGLGRVATPLAASTLWKLHGETSPEIQNAAWSGLQLAGDNSLESPGVDEKDRLMLAGLLETPKADTMIRNALSGPHTREALEAAAGRPTLVEPLTAYIRALNSATQGELADLAFSALAKSESGRKAIEALSADSAWQGFAERALS